jgi:uncharacterized protein YxeA
MKKSILILLILLLAISGALMAQEKADKSAGDNRLITKTYALKYIGPRVVDRTLGAYFHNSSYERNGSLFTVRILPANLEQFEKMLKELDVQRKTIQFRIFTLVASNEGKPEKIENPDLNRVLKELQKLLSFKAYRLDGVALLTAKDRGFRSSVKLSSHTPKLNLNLHLLRIKIMEEKGARHIDIDALELKSGKTSLIQTSATIKEDGYLVAGVSKIGENGDSLILVINADII